MTRLSPGEAIDSGDCLIDVRSPREFDHSHIPGAINIPVLDDYSHHEVGLVYRQLGKEAAIAKGLELTSPVLGDIYRQFDQLSGRVILYCARGGLRSQSLAHVLAGFGRPVGIIEGGYKAYREYVLRQTELAVGRRTFVVLQGHTGVGKTHILHELARRGYGSLDLETLARHAGSVFGHLAFRGDQPSQKQFENDLFEALRHLPPVVVLERESRKIGRLHLPNCLVDAIRQAKHVLLSTSPANRVATILEDYHPEWQSRPQEIIAALDHLRARLSHRVVDQLIDHVKHGRFEAVIRYLMEAYYDPLYQHSVRQRTNDYVLVCSFENREEAIEQIIRLINHLSGDTRLL